MDRRRGALEAWLQRDAGLGPVALTAASADASFRRYFRVHAGRATWIAMDAPPEQEDSRPFVAAAAALAALGLNVPRVEVADLDRGFLLLTDLGDRVYLRELEAADPDALYDDAIAALVRLQGGGTGYRPPDYDRALLMAEMGLFRDWFLERHLGIHLTRPEAAVLERVFQNLAATALEQPRVWVHRDYHSRNLMRVPEHNPGILDFQDMVVGPVTYDLVSLLRDCYVAWPPERIDAWMARYLAAARRAGLLSAADAARFPRWFDWMGVQRHLKAIGIFSRLYHRDGKPGYLADIPRTLGYVEAVCASHPELADLGALVRHRVGPQLAAAAG